MQCIKIILKNACFYIKGRSVHIIHYVKKIKLDHTFYSINYGIIGVLGSPIIITIASQITKYSIYTNYWLQNV